MRDEIINTVNEVRQKEKEGIKELKIYLSELEISTLNRLLIIFNEIINPKPITKFEVFSGAFTASIITGSLLFYVIIWPLHFAYIGNYLAMIFSFFAVIWIIKEIISENKNKSIIKRSNYSLGNKRIVTMIEFVLNEKYKRI